MQTLQTWSWVVAVTLSACGSSGTGPKSGGPGGLGLELIAGDLGGAGNVDGTGAAARFHRPHGVAVDGTGNAYVVDLLGQLRKIAPGGVVTTIASLPISPSSATGFTSVDGSPGGLAADAAGNIYVADVRNDAIRKVTPAGVVSVFAGIPGGGGSNSGPVGTARFESPRGVAVDASGIVYVADSSNQRIQKIAGGMVTTLAGSGVSGAMDGTAAAAQFFTPAAVAVGPDGTVYVADLNNQTVRKIAADGVVTTLAGSPRISGTVDGVGAAARFNRPVAIAVDGNGIVYVAEESGTGLRRIAPDGTVTTLAGTAGMVGSTDGNGAAARFGALAGLAVDGAGDVWVADADSHAVRKVTSAGAVTTVAGKPTDHGSNDGSIAEARFHFPVGIAVDDAGNLYVADAGNATVRKISAGGTVTTLAGSPGMTGTVDDTGPAARFRLPVDVAVDSDGNLYVADESDATIRKVAPGGVVTTLAGSPGSINGETDGVGANAHFVSPRGVAIDDSRALYITDISTNTIRKLTPFGAVGSVSTVAGAATAGNTDGLAAMARFNAPVGVAVDGAGNLYISDLDNATIRKMSAAGLVTTLAGSAGHAGYADGLGATARFATPTGIAVDDAGNVYVADGQNSVIRKVTPDGKVTTVAGKAGVAQVVLGQDPGLAFPCCVAIAGDSLLIVDQGAILRLHPR